MNHALKAEADDFGVKRRLFDALTAWHFIFAK